MAPETIAVTAAVVPAANKAVYAKQSAPCRPAGLEESPEQVVSELLAGLRHAGSESPDSSRPAGPEPSAPEHDAIGRFIAERHQEAVDFAFRITRDNDLAEDAVAHTYLELLEGRTSIPYFFRALKFNARDEMRKSQRRRSGSLDAMRGRRFTFQGQAEDSDLRCEVAPEDFASPHGDDRDPLTILVEREEAAIYGRMVRAALADPRWRYIKRRAWAKPLAACADLAPASE